MRIIHAHKYFYLRAGAERYMLSLMREQERLGHTVAPFSMHYPKNDASPWSSYWAKEIETESGTGKGFGAIRQTLKASWNRDAYKKMKAMIRVFKPDVVHVHNIYTHLSPSILDACKEEGVPVVMTVHDYALVSANHALWNGDVPMDLNQLGLFATARTRYIKGSYLGTFVLDAIQKLHNKTGMYEKFISRFLVSTKFMQRVLLKAGYRSEKIFVEGLMTENARVQKSARQDYVLFVGALEKYKGVQTLVEAMKMFPKFRLKIAGSGSCEHELKEQAKNNKNIEFLGFVKGDQLTKLMASARVSVVPSIWFEPYGLVAVEAMRLGTPVIVSNRGGLPELVEDGVSGRVFKAGNVRDLVETLREFIHSPAYARKIGEEAKKRAILIADPQKHVEKILEQYQEVIDR